VSRQHTEHLLWTNAVDRLLRSGHDQLERHLLLGMRYFGGQPYLLPDERPNPHIWVMGGPGTGKSSRVLAPLITQHVALGYSVLVLDPKPDPALFWSCQAECHHQSVPFRYVSITPGMWSYVFAPLAQSHAAAQTLASRAEVIIQSLNLDYGVRYGGSYFTTMDELFCVAVLSLFPDAKTPEAVARQAEQSPRLKRLLGERGFEDANHVRAIFSKLAGVTVFNPEPGQRGFTSEVLSASVDMRQLFYQPQVVYFALDSQQLRTSTRAALGLAFYNLLAAAKHVGPKPEVKVVCVLDEAQEAVGPNLAILMEQARSMGIRLILAHHSLEQLRKAEVDYCGTFEECTGLHVVFNPVAATTRKWLEESSGQRLYTSLGWTQTLLPGTDPLAAQSFRPELARRPSLLEFPAVAVAERLGPTWDLNTLMRLSAEEGVAWARLTRDTGYARDGGQWVPLRMLYHIAEPTFKARNKRPWPGPNGQTVMVERATPFDLRHQPPEQRPRAGPIPTDTRAAIRRLRDRP
jgi:hypothetical protein